MTTRHPRALFLTVFFLSAAFLAGCASTVIDWESRVGTYSYQDAVVELGAPQEAEVLGDGSRAAMWIWSRGGSAFAKRPSDYSRAGDFAGTQSSFARTPPDRILRLTFTPDGKLIDWSTNY